MQRWLSLTIFSVCLSGFLDEGEISLLIQGILALVFFLLISSIPK